MKRSRERLEGSALEILDGAVHLLRGAPAGDLAAFYAGAVPFALGLLHYWMDMRRSAFAHGHAGEAALGVAFLYLWMKAWQAVFARRLRARLSGAGGSPGVRPWARHLAAQIALQPLALFALPVALILFLPIGWVYAFFQNLSLTGDAAQARRLAVLWPGQNHLLIALLALFGLFVFLNLATLLFVSPWILQSLFGIETVFSRSPASMVNSTFLLVAIVMTWLATAPLARAAYVLRCFRGESLTTGEDLRGDLRALIADPGRAALVLPILATLVAAASIPSVTLAAVAAIPPAPPTAPAGAVEPARPFAGARGAGGPAAGTAGVLRSDDLDRAIRAVLETREFRWRIPREAPPDGQRGPIARFLAAVNDTIARWWRSLTGWLEPAGRWIRNLLDRLPAATPAPDTASGWPGLLPWIAGILIAAAVAVVAYVVMRRRRRETPAAAAVVTVAALPEDDSAAAEIPADRWIEAARDLAARGDLRAAARAVYLAMLSYLGERRLIAPARSKSNRDYLRELRRKTAEHPEIPARFEAGLAGFERVWYGRHPATEDLVLMLHDEFTRLRRHAEP